MTKFPDLFAALAAPFAPNEVKVRKQAGRDLHYITARTVMNRLDNVIGCENWWDDYTPGAESVICRLTIVLPDGRQLTKVDAGGYAGMSDQGDDDKSGFCLPLNAEALTLDGWKEYHELDVGAIILAYDPEDGVCKWTSVRHITVFDEPCPVVQMTSKSFRMLCTPNHRWVVKRRDKGVMLKETRDLDSRDAIINAAPAVGGEHPLTPREAAVLGWLATDGSIVRASRASEGRRDRQFHATIHQSKEPYRSEIRSLLGDDATEHVTQPTERLFPGSAVASAIRERSMFRLRNDFARTLLAKAGIQQWTDLIALVPRLSVAARGAMLKAMLDGDGQHSCSGQVTFGKKCKPGVMAAFEILATLEGIALGAPRESTTGDVPLRTLRHQGHVWAKSVEITPARSIPVWCPTTAFGTWVTRWNGTISITGNSDAFKRAAVKLGVGRYLYRDGVPRFDRERTGGPGPRREETPRGNGHDAAPARQGVNQGRPEQRRSENRVPDRSEVNDAFPARRDAGPSWAAYIADRADAARKHWASEMAMANVPVEQRSHPDNQMPNAHQATNHMISRAIQAGAVKAEFVAKEGKGNVRDPAKAKAAMEDLFRRAPSKIKAAVDAYYGEKERALRVSLGMDDVDDAGDPEPVEVGAGREPGEDG